MKFILGKAVDAFEKHAFVGGAACVLAGPAAPFVCALVVAGFLNEVVDLEQRALDCASGPAGSSFSAVVVRQPVRLARRPNEIEG